MNDPATTAHQRRGPRVAAMVLIVGMLLTACAQSTERRLVDGYFEEITEHPFYTLPSPVPAGQPGDIVRTEQLESAPDGTLAWRILYHSTDAAGADIVTSGTVITPTAAAPAGGRVVVGWAHPTTGAVAKCAPSNGIDPFDLIEGMTDLLNAGYAVAAADYPGLGVAGPSSYLIGTTEGNSVLDAIRAAEKMPETGASTGSDVLLWGHSQGGQAALFAGQDATSYAPELRVKAVAVAAPAADLGALLNDHTDDISGVTIGSYAYAAYQAAYSSRFPGLTLDSVLTPAGAAATPAMAQLCLLGQLDKLHAEADPLIGHYTRVDPATTEPWATLLSENTPGAKPLGVPLFVAQGVTDALVLLSATEGFVAKQCAAGEHVVFQTYPDTGHGEVALKAIPDVMKFSTGVLAGSPPASTC